MNIASINIDRYYNKAKRYKLGFVDTSEGISKDMISNFIEHCYNNKEIVNNFKDKIIELNNKINRI